MRYSAYPFLAGLLLLGTACTQDKVLQNPRSFASDTPARRDNDKSQFKKDHATLGLGLDLNANNPQKFRTVKAPPRYRY